MRPLNAQNFFTPLHCVATETSRQDPVDSQCVAGKN